MNGTFAELRAAGLSVARVCLLIGRARASHYRRVRGRLHGPRQARTVPDNGQPLTAVERAAVLRLINTPAYADLSIGQVSPWYVAWALVDQDGHDASGLVREWLRQMCDSTLHLDSYENALR